MKFGGSSVANADRIKHVAEIIQAYKDERPVVVLSAMGDTTDHLLEAADMAVKGTVDIEKIEKLHIETEQKLLELFRTKEIEKLEITYKKESALKADSNY